jgi:hypothetical protein
MINVLEAIYEIIISNYYFSVFIIFLVVLLYLIYKRFDTILKIIPVHPTIANKIELGSINKYKKLDNKCYSLFYRVYDMIGSTLNIEQSEIFDEKYLLKLNEAKKIFYGVKRNKELIKSNFILLKILKKIKTYEIAKNEIDDTIIYLMLLVLNKKK